MGAPYSIPFPPSYFAPNRVDLITQEPVRYEEKLTNGAIPPGSLVQEVGGYLAVHATAGGPAENAFALEHRFETATGGGLPVVYAWDNWASGSIASYVIAKSGDMILALAKTGYSYTDGMFLTSAGDGTLMPLPAVSRADRILYESVAASTAISGVSTITPFDTTYTIPANTLGVGDVLRIRGQTICTATNSTDTLILTLIIGTTTIIATAAVDVANSDVGVIDVYLVIRTIGASGTFVANGEWDLGVPGTATERVFALGSTAIDTTVTQAITLNATWSTTNAGNSVRCDELLVSLNRNISYMAIAVAKPPATLDLTTTTTTTTALPGTTVPASQSPANALIVRIL